MNVTRWNRAAFISGKFGPISNSFRPYNTPACVVHPQNQIQKPRHVLITETYRGLCRQTDVFLCHWLHYSSIVPTNSVLASITDSRVARIWCQGHETMKKSFEGDAQKYYEVHAISSDNNWWHLMSQNMPVGGGGRAGDGSSNFSCECNFVH